MSNPQYAPYPLRALRDQRLTGLHLRVLGVIAAHDRLNKNGQGCRAGNKRLAELSGCHLKSLSPAIKALAELGYIEADTNPLNRRSRIYTVIYTDEDAESFGFRKPARIARQGCDQEMPQQGEIGNHQPTQNPAIGNHQPTQTIDNPLNSGRNTNRIYSVKQKIDFVETKEISCKNAGFSEGARGEVFHQTSQPRAHGSRSIGGVISQLLGPPSVTTLSSQENERINGEAQARIAEKLGSDGQGWLILSSLSDTTVDRLTTKQLTNTLIKNDIAAALAEAGSGSFPAECYAGSAGARVRYSLGEK